MSNSLHAQSSSEYTTHLHRVQTHDPSEHAQHLSGWRLAYDQLSPGPFVGELIEFRLGEVQLVRDRSNQAMKKSGAAVEGSIAFCVNLKYQGDVYCSGHLISAPSLLVAQGDNMPELKVPEIVDILLVSIHQDTLQHTLERQGSSFQLIDHPMCYHIGDASAWYELKNVIDELVNGRFGGEALQHASIREDLRAAVTLHLLDIMTRDEPLSLKPTARKRMVDRACEYAMNHLDEPFTILDLCNNIGASRRKLQYCFQEAFGINPVAYLRALRLNSVRRELREKTSASSIQDVAARWGFWHMGRFSVEYRALFGESPTHTLQR